MCRFEPLPHPERCASLLSDGCQAVQGRLENIPTAIGEQGPSPASYSPVWSKFRGRTRYRA